MTLGGFVGALGCSTSDEGSALVEDGSDESIQPDSPPGSDGGDGTGVDSGSGSGGSGSGTDEGWDGWFETGQDASVLLGGIDFNDSGGGNLFNHPKGLATDGTRLLVADGNNNRVLVWTTLPNTNNQSPDLVLGQPDFDSNNPGSTESDMHWPVAVAVADGKVVVADTYNHRILVWNSFPTRNGQAADLVLNGFAATDTLPLTAAKDKFAWPWGVWTDGDKLVVSSTVRGTNNGSLQFGGWVLIWNSFPTTDGTEADIILTADGGMGTPRAITSDGNTLIVGDHNAQGQTEAAGSWVWTTFPTSDEQGPSYFLVDSDAAWIWLQGDVSTDGKLAVISSTIYIWDSFPQSASTPPDIALDGGPYGLRGGDGADVALTDTGAMFVSDYNSNRVLVFESMPTSNSDSPDFVLGASDLSTFTFEDNYFITNPTPISDGTSLFVADGYDKRLNGWEVLPTESLVAPDSVYDLGDGLSGIAMNDGTLVVNGSMDGIVVWNSLPFAGEDPDLVLGKTVGSITLGSITGIALDDTYFYVVGDGGTLYVWEGIPTTAAAPVYTLELGAEDYLLYSDGNHLTASSGDDIRVFAVSNLNNNATAMTVDWDGWSVVLEQSIVHNNHVFVADRGFHRVYGWRDLDDALAGDDPDVLLGAEDFTDTEPNIGTDGLFWPYRLAFDGRSLWVGEYKFSGRTVAFPSSE